jgi:hypothetical protein
LAALAFLDLGSMTAMIMINAQQSNLSSLRVSAAVKCAAPFGGSLTAGVWKKAAIGSQ